MYKKQGYYIAASINEATGVSRPSVYKILKEGEKLLTSGYKKFVFYSKRKIARHKKNEVDSFTDNAKGERSTNFTQSKLSPSQ